MPKPANRDAASPSARSAPPPSPDAVTLTIDGARAVCGLPRTTLYGLIGRGVLQTRKAGRRTLITGESLRSYLAGLPAAAISPPRKQAA